MLKLIGFARRSLRSLVVLGAVGVVLAAGVLYAAQDSSSQPKTGLAVSPPTFELTANPGDVLKNSVRVDNVTTSQLDLEVDTRNFTALGEEGGINLSEAEGRYSLANWIAVSPSQASVGPGESKVFSYTITVPSDAEPGGRFGSIVFKTAAKPVTGQTGVAIAQEVGALVLVKIAGEVNEKASIASFGALSALNDRGPVGFEVRVKNQGNVQFKPTGTITISNFFGRKVATIPIDSQNVLPEATRKMTAKWKQSWLFGKYNATASIVYGSDRQVLTASTTFWGFPYKLVGVILLAIGIVGLLLYPRRARIRRALKILFGRD